jgi:hypothetical protein
MSEEITQCSIVFHERAQSAFFSIYGEFKQAIASIDRQGDENVFQRLQNRYASQLQLQLHNIALEILGQVDTAQRNKLSFSLSQSIEEYIREFLQKAKSL